MEQNTETAKLKTISIKRTFDMPAATVWKCWTEPESFKKWWGPKEYTCPDCKIDLKVGGKLVASMMDEKGKKTWSTGTYKEIIPQRKLVVTDSFADEKGNIVPSTYYNMPEMALKCLVTVQLEEMNGKTEFSLQHEGMAEEMAEDCIKGWQSSLDKIDENFKK